MTPTPADQYSISRYSADLEKVLIAYEDLRQAISEAGLDTDQIDELLVLLQTAFNKSANIDEFENITIDTPPAEIMAVKTNPWAQPAEERKKPEAAPIKKAPAVQPVQAPKRERVSKEMTTTFR